MPSAYSQFVLDTIEATEIIVALVKALSIEMVAQAYQKLVPKSWCPENELVLCVAILTDLQPDLNVEKRDRIIFLWDEVLRDILLILLLRLLNMM